jgi:hypothetical protein
MAAITADEARAYFDRWEACSRSQSGRATADVDGHQASQLGSLMPSRQVFGPEPNREEEIAAVRERWNRGFTHPQDLTVAVAA